VLSQLLTLRCSSLVRVVVIYSPSGTQPVAVFSSIRVR